MRAMGVEGWCTRADLALARGVLVLCCGLTAGACGGSDAAPPAGPPSRMYGVRVVDGAGSGTVRVTATLAGGDLPTRATGTLRVELVRAPVGTTDTAADATAAGCAGERAVADADFSEGEYPELSVELPLVPACPAAPSGHHTYARVTFAQLPPVLAAAPRSLGGDFEPGVHESGDARRAALQAAGVERERALADFRPSLARAAAAVSAVSDVSAVTPCAPGRQAGHTGRAGLLVTEERLRLIAGTPAGAAVPPPTPDVANPHGFLTDDVVDHFVSPSRATPSDETSAAIAAAPEHLRVVRVAELVRPDRVEGDTFVAGRFRGTLFVVNRTSGALVCAAPLDVTQSAGSVRFDAQSATGTRVAREALEREVLDAIFRATPAELTDP